MLTEKEENHVYKQYFTRPKSSDEITAYINILNEDGKYQEALVRDTNNSKPEEVTLDMIIGKILSNMHNPETREGTEIKKYDFPDTDDISYNTIDSINANIEAIQTTLIGDGVINETVSDEKPPESPSDEPDLDNSESDDEGKPEQPTFNADQQKKMEKALNKV